MTALALSPSALALAAAAGSATAFDLLLNAVWVSAQDVQGLGRAPRATALALSPNALAFAAVGPGAGGAGCRLRIALLPGGAGDAPARDAGEEEPAAARGSLYGDRRAPHAGGL